MIIMSCVKTLAISSVCAVGIANIVSLLYRLFWMKRNLVKSVRGKVVLISGGSSGLGCSLAEVLHGYGCKVILASRQLDKLKEIALSFETIRSEQQTFPVIYRYLDLADPRSIPGSADDLLNVYGKIDIVICNAGISHRGTIADTLLNVHENIMMVNYFGHVELIRCLLPYLIDQSKQSRYHSSNGPQIVGISSIQGLFSIPYRSAYSASKHALQAFFNCLRAEQNDNGISVLTVSPGYIATNLSVNAVTASGNNYGKMDETTAKGMSSKYAAQRIVESIAFRDKHLILSDMVGKFALWMQFLSPALYYWTVARRAKMHM